MEFSFYGEIINKGGEKERPEWVDSIVFHTDSATKWLAVILFSLAVEA